MRSPRFSDLRIGAVDALDLDARSAAPEKRDHQEGHSEHDGDDPLHVSSRIRNPPTTRRTRPIHSTSEAERRVSTARAYPRLRGRVNEPARRFLDAEDRSQVGKSCHGSATSSQRSPDSIRSVEKTSSGSMTLPSGSRIRSCRGNAALAFACRVDRAGPSDRRRGRLPDPRRHRGGDHRHRGRTGLVGDPFSRWRQNPRLRSGGSTAPIRRSEKRGERIREVILRRGPRGSSA